MQDNLPIFDSLDKLRQVYQELGAGRHAYIKSFVRVYYKSGGSFVDAVIHDEKGHAKLNKTGYINVVKVVPELNIDGQPYRLVEYTQGALYNPQWNGLRYGLGYEWALCLKIDGDLARKKTGFVEDGLIHYLADNPVEPKKTYNSVIYNRLMFLSAKALEGFATKQEKDEAKELRSKLEKITGVKYRYSNSGSRGPKEKTNAQDLFERYEDPNTRKWIEKNKKKLNSNKNKFHHDNFTDRVLKDSVSLSEIEINTED